MTDALELNIQYLRKLCTKDNIRITLHAAKRLEQRGIFLRDVMTCIQSGAIIEQYPKSYPYPSCLVLGFSTSDKHMHTVIGTDSKILFLITAYYPDAEQWENNFKTRKEH